MRRTVNSGDSADCFVFFQSSSFYLVVKGSVGRFLHRRLFLLIADLDHHAGVDVFSHQLPALRDVNGNLSARAKLQLIFLCYGNLCRFLYFQVWCHLEALRFPFTFLDASFQLGPGEKFHTRFSSVRSVQAQPSIMIRKSALLFRCEKVKPLGVWDESGPDFRLIFCTFLIGHRRPLLQLSVCSKTTPAAFPAAVAAAT